MKNVLLTFLIINFAAGVQAQSLNDSLLLHYSLNGNAIDSSGNNFHGTIFNAVPTTDRNGNPNSALYFNGTNSYIDWPNHPMLKPQLPISFSFWVNFDNHVASNCYVFTSDYKKNTYTGVWASLASSTWTMGIHFGDGTPGMTSPPTRRTMVGTTVFDPGVWYHVTGVIRGPGDMDIWVNCRSNEGTYSGTGGNLAYSNNPGSIGRLSMAGQPVYYFKGSLDDFRFWERELTAFEVHDLCNPAPSSANFQEQGNSLFTVYPNPAEDILYLPPIIQENKSIYKIYSTTGQLVMEGPIPEGNNKPIDISMLNSGLYIITIAGDNQDPRYSRFIKQ